MFHIGRIKENLNFKRICPLKQKEQNTRITYKNNYQYFHIYPETRKLRMEEWGRSSFKKALENVGGYSRISWHWEIYKLLIILQNINPIWIEVNKFNDDYPFKVFNIHYVCQQLINKLKFCSKLNKSLQSWSFKY